MEELTVKQNETELVAALHNGMDLPLPFEQDIFLYGTEIAGTNHRENIEALYEMIREGDMLTLIREPENPYDEYAIRIDVDDDGLPGDGPGRQIKNAGLYSAGFQQALCPADGCGKTAVRQGAAQRAGCGVL